MTEKDFWTKYFRAEYLHSTKNAVAAAAEAAEDEELAIFLKDDDILADAARQKVLFLRVGVSLFFFLRDTPALFCMFTWVLLLFCIFCLQIRRVDPTLDMEADQGDDYMHLPVCGIRPLL